MPDITKYFWDYAKNINKIATLESTFIEWANDYSIDFDTAKIAWDLINKDVKIAFTPDTSLNGSGTGINNSESADVTPLQGADINSNVNSIPMGFPPNNPSKDEPKQKGLLELLEEPEKSETPAMV